MKRAFSAALLSAALLAGLAGAQGAAATAPEKSAAQESVRVRLECQPSRVEIGQPVEWILTVEHPREIAVKVPELNLAADDTWVMLGERSVVNDPRASSEESVETRVTWRMLSLESGARTLPPIEISYERDGTPHTAAAAPTVLDVRGELGPDEDAPRPMKGFLPAPAGAEAERLWTWIAVLAVLSALALVAAWIVRRSRKKPAPLARATALDRLADLERGLGLDPSAGRAITYSTSMLLRESVDAFARESRAGLTDLDWIERIEHDERLPLGVRSASARILRESEQVKYALHVPTRFAVEEMLRDARNALEALAAAPAPEIPSAAPRPDSTKEAA